MAPCFFASVLLFSIVSSCGVVISDKLYFSERAGLSDLVAKGRQEGSAPTLNDLVEKDAPAVHLYQLTHRVMPLLADLTSSSFHTLSIKIEPVLPLSSFSRFESALGALSVASTVHSFWGAKSTLEEQDTGLYLLERHV